MKLVDPNDNLASEYFQNAEETLRVTSVTKETGTKTKLAIQKYYAEIND